MVINNLLLAKRPRVSFLEQIVSLNSMSYLRLIGGSHISHVSYISNVRIHEIYSLHTALFFLSKILKFLNNFITLKFKA